MALTSKDQIAHDIEQAGSKLRSIEQASARAEEFRLFAMNSVEVQGFDINSMSPVGGPVDEEWSAAAAAAHDVAAKLAVLARQERERIVMLRQYQAEQIRYEAEQAAKAVERGTMGTGSVAQGPSADYRGDFIRRA